jgi:hypothetical protein
MSFANAPLRSSWEELYQAALGEEDREKLTGLVGAVEAAIVRRRQELTSIVEENEKECAAMVLAAQEILKIKAEKLGWPPLRPNSALDQNSEVIDRIRRVESIHHWHR